MENEDYDIDELEQRYGKVGLSPYIRQIFARARAAKAYKDRREGPISGFVIPAITNCITNRFLLNIFYEPGKEEHTVPGYRWIECYTWGLSKFTGNNLLRAYQVSGTGDTGFKTWRLDRIRNTAVTSKKFNKPRALYNGPSDADMGIIYLTVKFPPPKNG